MPARALILGAAGQDGSYLTEWLLGKGYQVYGVVRSLEPQRLHRLESSHGRIVLFQNDLSDLDSLVELLEQVQPDEIYNLAADGFVPASWNAPLETLESTGLSAVRLLEAVRRVNPRGIRLFQAASSEVFGLVDESPQNESTPHRPIHPYGAAKALAHSAVEGYRRRYGLFCVSGVLYNHESPRRSEQFVPRKISASAARIKRGLADRLVLGNLDVRRDWGFAGDYVQAMHRMLQLPQPEDFVIGTGRTHSVRELARLAFDRVGLDADRYIDVDPELVRPAEKTPLVADARKAARLLEWTPSMEFPELVHLLVDADLALLDR